MESSTTLPFHVSAFLFDLDNTLFDRDLAFLTWAHNFIQTRLQPQDEAAEQAALNLLLELDAHGYGPKPAMFAAVKRSYPTLDEPVETLVEAFYTTMIGHGFLDDDTRLLLDTLAANNVPFGIVTNGSRNQLHKIRQLELDARTSCIFVSELCGWRKPDPAIFNAAAAKLGFAPTQILFAGDNPEADICGAHAIGMRTAWLHRNTTWPTHLDAACADLTISSLTALLPFASPPTA